MRNTLIPLNHNHFKFKGLQVIKKINYNIFNIFIILMSKIVLNRGLKIPFQELFFVTKYLTVSFFITKKVVKHFKTMFNDFL